MEPFHVSAMGSGNRIRSINTSGGSTTYQFRQPQTGLNPLALRRMQLADVISQRREDERAGQQELEAMKEMARLAQQEYKIKQEIATTRDVVNAQRQIAKLDPRTDPNYIQSFAKVMGDHQLAAKDKFLNDEFTHGAGVFRDAMKAKLADASEEFKTKQHISEAEAKDNLKLIGEATANGIDVEDHRADSGGYDFPGIRSTVAARIAKARETIDAAKAAMSPKSVVMDSSGKERVTYAEKAPDKPAISPAEVFQTTTKILKLQGVQETNRVRSEALQQVVNDPNASAKDKQEAKGKLAAFSSDKAGLDLELGGLRSLINPPAPKTDGAPIPPAPTGLLSEKPTPLTMGGVTIGNPAGDGVASQAMQGGAPTPPATDAADPTEAPSEFTDPDHVKNEYKAGRLSRDQAMSVLKDQFGHTD